jgi:menaquinone-specific isochorismate synthase
MARRATVTSAARPRLVARTRELEVDVDPLIIGGAHGLVFTHPSGSLAGTAPVLRLPLPHGVTPEAVATFARDTLAAIDTDDAVGLPGCGPVAFGALPFAWSPDLEQPNVTAELVVPQMVVGRAEDGRRWVTTIFGEDETRGGAHEQALAAFHPDIIHALGEHELVDEGVEHDLLPGAFEVVATMAPNDWCTRVAKACEELRSGTLRKVVLAREVDVRADRPISRRAVLERLRDAYPGCMLFAVDNFVGASPELLVARHGDRVRSHPLAGTAPRSADLEADARLAAELRASDKNREEHRITIDMVHETLIPYCSYLDEEAEPSIVPMANVMHLGTMVEGQLSSPPPSVLELALNLHPTPAVGGWPVEHALDLINDLEGIDRGRYAGPVGWVDAAGNGEWAVGIRSAEIGDDGLTARVFAGVGVVADSDPQAELAETRAKFQAMLSAIIRP